MPEPENTLQSSLAELPEHRPVETKEDAPEGELSEIESVDASEKETVSEKPTEDSGNFIESLAPEAQKAFKTLQTKLNKSNEGLKGFEKFGGAEQAIQWLSYLAEDKNFAEWVTTQQNPQEASKLSEEVDDGMDEETRRAMEIVRKLAQEEAQKAIAPLTAVQSRAKIHDVMGEMDTKYPQWREVQEDMGRMASNLPENVQNNPSVKDLEALYFMTLADSGKMDDYAANVHEAKLRAMKEKTTPKPVAQGRATPNMTAKSFKDAARMAKEQLGL